MEYPVKILIVALLFCSVAAVVTFAKEAKEIIVDENTTIIDVRTPAEYKEGHLEPSVNIPHTEIKEKIAGVVADKARKIIVYCRSGRRSGIAAKALKELGYTNVTNAGAYKQLTVKKETGEKDQK